MAKDDDKFLTAEEAVQKAKDEGRYLSVEDAAKMFEGDVIEAIPTDMKRIIIPAYGFTGATPQKRPEWDSNGDMFMEDVKGLAFVNPKDHSGETTKKGKLKPNQVLKQNDGVIVCYDAPGRKEKIEKYLAEHPKTFDNNIRLGHFINYLTNSVVAGGGKPDLWDADVAFAANLKDAPAKEDIKPGQVFTGVKKKEVAKVFKVPEGIMFESRDQVAQKGGAYIVKDSKGMRLVQADAFAKSYQITKMPKTMAREIENVK